MKNGVAIWHYRNRTVLENAEYFADHGFDSVSLHGASMHKIAKSDEEGAKLAEVVARKNLVLSVHHKLPIDHSEKSVAVFLDAINAMGKWQEKYGLLGILSFDVPLDIRDNITPYVDYVLKTVGGCKIALEDFGLTDAERAQIEHLKGNPRFGFLVDIGHMNIRLCGKNDSGNPLFTNFADECPASEKPGYEEFLRAFRSKEFPIFELHLHNNNGIDDQHYFIEDGPLDIPAVAKVMKTLGFDGVVTNESAPGYTFECPFEVADRRIGENLAWWKELCK